MLFDLISDLQVHDREDGGAIVSRSPDTAGATGVAGRVPIDPETGEFLSGIRRFSFVILAVGAVACAGGGRLIQTGDLVLGTAVIIVGLLVTVMAAPGFVVRRLAHRNSRYLVLAPEPARRFRKAVAQERAVFGPKTTAEETADAADRLWALALDLAQPARSDEAEPPTQTDRPPTSNPAPTP